MVVGAGIFREELHDRLQLQLMFGVGETKPRFVNATGEEEEEHGAAQGGLWGAPPPFDSTKIPVCLKARGWRRRPAGGSNQSAGRCDVARSSLLSGLVSVIHTVTKV